MKQSLLLVASNLVSLACVATAAFLAIHGMRGWGWFLFASLLCMHGISSTKETA